MKYSDCNEKQKKAWRNIQFSAEWIIGGYENTMLDYEEDSEEYQSAARALKDHDELVDEIYQEAISVYHEPGMACFNASAKRYLNDIKFCGKEWLMERVDRRVRKLGY